MLSARVVNVRVAHIRPRYHNLKEWCQDPNNVYIGRGSIVFIDGVRYPPTDSPFANPFKVPKGAINSISYVNAYRDYIINRLNNEPRLLEQLRQLRGKNLGCWCAEYNSNGVRTNPGQCHGDILVDILNSNIFDSS